MFLETDGLVKQYNNRIVVNHVSFSIKQGEIVGLLGANGAGKTTSFYMTVGLVRPDKGRVRFNGKDITEYPINQRSLLGISYLPQETSIFRKMSVENNIKAVLDRRGYTKQKSKMRLEELLEELGVTHIRKNKGYSLSGGEKRRVEIARALAIDPLFVLLDEPFAGVDPISVHDIQATIRYLCNKGIGILITDHNVRETLQISDRAYILNMGNILVEGTPDEIVANELAQKYYLGEKFSL